MTDSQSKDTHIGQYFRDFANFGRPLNPAPMPKHVYLMLVCSCLRDAWADLRYIPTVVMDQYRMNHPTKVSHKLAGMVALGTGLVLAYAVLLFVAVASLIETIGNLMVGQ